MILQNRKGVTRNGRGLILSGYTVIRIEWRRRIFKFYLGQMVTQPGFEMSASRTLYKNITAMHTCRQWYSSIIVKLPH
jgi:hypothetical protein